MVEIKFTEFFVVMISDLADKGEISILVESQQANKCENSSQRKPCPLSLDLLLIFSFAMHNLNIISFYEWRNDEIRLAHINVLFTCYRKLPLPILEH